MLVQAKTMKDGFGVGGAVTEERSVANQRLSEIKKFIEALARVGSSETFLNQYSYDVRANFIRRNNLLLYLLQMAALNPSMLLVGEAPGYRGCRLTGVPFTSEHILLAGLESLGLFGESRGYRKTDEFENPWKEGSASIVWETLQTNLLIPLIWNAFPFHPFQLRNEQSNRKPTKAELTIGQEFLQELIRVFDIKIIVAVGNTAGSSLKTMGISCQKVRHPSYGGKTKFMTGIKDVINNDRARGR